MKYYLHIILLVAFVLSAACSRSIQYSALKSNSNVIFLYEQSPWYSLAHYYQKNNIQKQLSRYSALAFIKHDRKLTA